MSKFEVFCGLFGFMMGLIVGGGACVILDIVHRDDKQPPTR